MQVEQSQERRLRRSDDPMTAVVFQLEHIRELYGLDDVVLASEDGLTVAYAGDVWRSYLLAAFAAEYAAHGQEREALKERAFEPYLKAVDGSHVSVSTFHTGASPVHLCVVGSWPDDHSRCMEHARVGIARIIAQAA